MSEFKIDFDYDRQFDSLFIYCSNEYEYDISLELEDDIVVDFDKNNVPVAFEFLNASKLFNINKNDFSSLVHISIQSNITEDQINLAIHLVAVIRNKQTDFDKKLVASNLSNIPNCTSELVTA